MAQQLPDYQIENILTNARFKFALKCLKTIVDLNENKNAVFSPYSIYEELLLVYLASSGDTEKDLRCKLRLPNNNSIQEIITEWIMKKRKKNNNLPNSNEEEGYRITNTNSCWITNIKCVNHMTQCLFEDELEIVGFHQAYISLKNWINELLREKTNGYICTPVELNCIYEKMEIILSTVLCLKGDIFNKPDDPTDEERHLNALRRPRTVVSIKLEMIVTRLTLEDKNLSLFLCFPAVKFVNCAEWQVAGRISELINRLTTKRGTHELRNVLDYLEFSAIEWTADKDKVLSGFFRLENELPIDQLLDKLGIQNLLEPDKATLSNFTDQNLHIGGALHQAFIQVTRHDVMAGAVNMFFTKNEGSFKLTAGINDCKSIKKCILLLYCKKSHNILFAGIINENEPLSPTKSKAPSNKDYSN